MSEKMPLEEVLETWSRRCHNLHGDISKGNTL